MKVTTSLFTADTKRLFITDFGVNNTRMRRGVGVKKHACACTAFWQMQFSQRIPFRGKKKCLSTTTLMRTEHGVPLHFFKAFWGRRDHCNVNIKVININDSNEVIS